MDSERPDLRSSLQALAAAERRRLSAHLEPERLLAYRAGELTEREAETVRDHLALCPECAELLLDFDEFTPDASSAAKAAISDEEIQTAWTVLRDRLAREGRLPADAPNRPAARSDPKETAPPAKNPLPFVPASRRASPALAYALAASLAACAGLSGWVAVLHGRIGAVVAAVAQPVTVFDGGTRGSETETPVATSPDSPQVFLRFRRLTTYQLSAYKANILKATKPPKRIVDDLSLPLDSDGDAMIELAKAAFPPGLYRVEIYGEDHGKWTKVEVHTFRPESP